MLIKADRSALLVIDVQAGLVPAVRSPDETVDRVVLLMKAAERLGVPMLISEEYPKGLGHTVPEVAAEAPEGAIMEKIVFSCTGEEACAERLGALHRAQVVLAGMETHVCVLQTAMGLKASGYEPFVAADATSSRRSADHELGLQRLRDAAVPIVSAEMVVFEWLERADTPEFRDLLPLVKGAPGPN